MYVFMHTIIIIKSPQTIYILIYEVTQVMISDEYNTNNSRSRDRIINLVTIGNKEYRYRRDSISNHEGYSYMVKRDNSSDDDITIAVMIMMR